MFYMIAKNNRNEISTLFGDALSEILDAARLWCARGFIVEVGAGRIPARAMTN